MKNANAIQGATAIIILLMCALAMFLVPLDGQTSREEGMSFVIRVPGSSYGNVYKFTRNIPGGLATCFVLYGYHENSISCLR